MFAFAHSLHACVHPLSFRRAIYAGVAWGLALTAGLTAISAWQCGGICIDETLWLATLSIPAGILTIGPIAALGRR